MLALVREVSDYGDYNTPVPPVPARNTLFGIDSASPTALSAVGADCSMWLLECI